MSKVEETNPFYYGRPGGEQIAGAPVVEKKLAFDNNLVVRKTVLPAPLPVLSVPVFPGPGDLEGSDELEFLEDNK